MTEALREAQPLVAQSEERNPNGEREAIAKLGAGDLSAFVARAKADAGFPLEPEAIEALNQLARRRAPDFERLRARLKAETKVRFAALEAVMKAEAANGDSGDSGGDGVAGRPVRFEEIEPWNEPVDGSRLLAEISKSIGAYVVMDAHQRDATALWTVFAHAHDLRDYAPLLAVTAPTKRCGKTRLQETLARAGSEAATDKRDHCGFASEVCRKASSDPVHRRIRRTGGGRPGNGRKPARAAELVVQQVERGCAEACSASGRRMG